MNSKPRYVFDTSVIVSAFLFRLVTWLCRVMQKQMALPS